MTYDEACDWVVAHGAEVDDYDAPDGTGGVRVTAAGVTVTERVILRDVEGRRLAFRIAVGRLAAKVSSGI